MATENDTLRSALGRNCPGVVQGWSRGGPGVVQPLGTPPGTENPPSAPTNTDFLRWSRWSRVKRLYSRHGGGDTTKKYPSRGVCVMYNTPKRVGHLDHPTSNTLQRLQRSFCCPRVQPERLDHPWTRGGTPGDTVSFKRKRLPRANRDGRLSRPLRVRSCVSKGLPPSCTIQ